MTDERRTTGSMRLAQLRVTTKIECSCFYLALVRIDNLVLLSPPLRQAQKLAAILWRHCKIETDSKKLTFNDNTNERETENSRRV
jgi:hypothetical protein